MNKLNQIREVSIQYKSGLTERKKVNTQDMAIELSKEILKKYESTNLVALYFDNSLNFKGEIPFDEKDGNCCKNIIKKALVTNSINIILAFKKENEYVSKVNSILKSHSDDFNINLMDAIKV